MGLFDVFKKEVQREFIARPDSEKDSIIYKWPDKNIRKFTQVTVQPDELAVFFKDGKVVGTLDSGQHRIDGQAIPFLNLIIDAATGGNLMIAELYFVSTRQFTDIPFGGSVDNVEDPKTKLGVGLRVYGTYSIKASKPEDLIVNLVGTKGMESNDDVTNWVSEQIMKDFKDMVTEKVTKGELPVLGIAAQTEELEKLALEGVKEHLTEYGLAVAKFGNFTINMKEEDEATLKTMMRDKAYTESEGLADTAVKMGLAEGLKKGGDASSTVGVGVGMGVGQEIAKGMTKKDKSEKKEEPKEE
jgi:membrane protease subunit (stomatin/prohibitin family)